MPSAIELSESDLRVILDSLDYSYQKVGNYRHIDHASKRASLEPIQAVLGKVRRLIAIRKEATHGTANG